MTKNNKPKPRGLKSFDKDMEAEAKKTRLKKINSLDRFNTGKYYEDRLK